MIFSPHVKRARRMPCPNFHPRQGPLITLASGYPTVAGTGSSTLASRRNFAASSGGVGLI